MNTKKSYAEKLKDPRWQKKRLQILNRDGFACVRCTNDKRELHIHHLIYTKGEEPWETDDVFLVTLCDLCHKNVRGTEEKLALFHGVILRSGVDEAVFWELFKRIQSKIVSFKYCMFDYEDEGKQPHIAAVSTFIDGMF